MSHLEPPKAALRSALPIPSFLLYETDSHGETCPLRGMFFLAYVDDSLTAFSRLRELIRSGDYEVHVDNKSKFTTGIWFTK